MAGVEHGSGAPTHRTPGTLRDSEVKYFQEPHHFENLAKLWLSRMKPITTAATTAAVKHCLTT